MLTFTLPATAADLSLDQAFDQLRTYDDGQPNQALAVIERHVGRVSKDPELRPKTAGRLAAIVADAQTSAAARLFACQQLKLVAHEAEVPLLARLLEDPKTADLGRLVLETMPGEEATRALIAALDRASGDALVGVIHSLGARRATDAAVRLGKLVGSSDPKVAGAAAAALGRMGRPSGAPRAGTSDPILACAERVAALGETTMAAAIYRSRWGADRPDLSRMAALAGMARVAPAEALPWVIEALHAHNEQLQGLAAEVARHLPGAEATTALAGEATKLNGTLRVLLLGTLAERGERSAGESLLAMAKNQDAALRNTATGELRRLRAVTKDAAMLAQVDTALGSPAISVQTLDPEPYSESVIQQRHDQVAKALAAGDRLACYLDCGVQARAERGGVTIRQLGGRAYQFPGAEQAAGPTFGTVAFDAPRVDFEIAGLDPKKAYALGFSWWDYDGGKRVQSVRFTGGEPAKTETALKDTPLPAYAAGRKGPAVGRLPIPAALLSSGKVRLSISHSQGPNAVVGELWLIETQAGSSTATQASLDGVTLAAAAPPSLDAPADGTKVLLVTGNDYPGHPWRQTAPVLKSLLEKDPRLKVRVVEDPNALGSPKLKDWDAVIIHFMDWEVPGPGPDARENLQRFVAGGKGLMLTHFACGAWDGNEWPEFKNLAGRAWDPKLRGHDPHGKFRVDIADPEHPITQGLKPFETVDELYTCLAGDAPIHVVAKATSKVDRKEYPMAFVLNYGQGRVFHSVLGHDALAYTNTPAVGELLRRGCAWTARLSPVPPPAP